MFPSAAVITIDPTGRHDSNTTVPTSESAGHANVITNPNITIPNSCLSAKAGGTNRMGATMCNTFTTKLSDTPRNHMMHVTISSKRSAICRTRANGALDKMNPAFKTPRMNNDLAFIFFPVMNATLIGEGVRWSLWAGRAFWIVGLALVLASLLWAALSVLYLCTCCGCCHPRLQSTTTGELFWMCFVACATLVTMSMAIGPTRVAAIFGWATWTVQMLFTPLGYVLERASELASLTIWAGYHMIVGVDWVFTGITEQALRPVMHSLMWAITSAFHAWAGVAREVFNFLSTFVHF